MTAGPWLDRSQAWQPLADGDPVPGRPDAVVELADRWARVADLTSRQADAVRRAAGGEDWAGEAADAFRGRAEELPQDLDRVATRLRHVALALSAYARELESAQRAAGAALDRAWAAQRRAGVAAGAPGPLGPVLLAGAISPDERELRADLAAESRALARAVADRDQAAARCARSLRRAADDGLRDPHGWRRLLRAVSAAAGAVSSRLGVAAVLLCWVPGLGEVLGALALSAAALTLLSDGALAAGGDRDWRRVALDGVGVLPVGRALRMGALLPREAVQARAVARAATGLRPLAEGRSGAEDLARAVAAGWAARSWAAFLRSRGGLLDDLARARQLRRGGASLVVGSVAVDAAQVTAEVAVPVGAGGSR